MLLEVPVQQLDWQQLLVQRRLVVAGRGLLRWHLPLQCVGFVDVIVADCFGLAVEIGVLEVFGLACLALETNAGLVVNLCGFD